MNEAPTLLELAAKGGSLGGWAFAVFFGWAHWRGFVRWGRDFAEQEKRHELELANLKAAHAETLTSLKLSHAETVTGLKERLLSDTTGLREQLVKTERQRDRWEAIVTKAVTTAESLAPAAGATTTKPPGAEM